MRLHALIGLVMLGTLLGGTAALGRSSVDDLSVRVNFGPPLGFLATSSTTLLNTIEFDVVSDSGAPQTITMRFALPAGLSFGSDVPDATEGCTNGTPVVCTDVLDQPGSGAWGWPVVADSAGTYAVTATVEGQRPDPNPNDNTYTFRFEIKRSVTVSAGAVKLTPAKPRAGLPVLASARVTADGLPVRPTRVVCTGTLAGRRITGKASAAAGRATCRYTTKKSHKGKILVGSLKITAKGKTVTKRFAKRLR
jgi:hypothetical protein